MSDETMPPGDGAAFSVDDLIEDFTSGHSDNYEITLSTGRVLVVRDVIDGKELNDIAERIKFLVNATKRTPAADWLPYLPASESIVTAAAWLERVSVSPKFSFVDGLKMGKFAAALLLEIASTVLNRSTGNVVSVEAARVEEAKNE